MDSIFSVAENILRICAFAMRARLTSKCKSFPANYNLILHIAKVFHFKGFAMYSTYYRIEGNIGGLQLWRILCKSMFDEINFGEFEAPFKFYLIYRG